MRICEYPEAPAHTGGLSLILPLSRGQVLGEQTVDAFRRILEQDNAFGPIEIIAVGGRPLSVDFTHVEMDGGDWSAAARAGLAAASGDLLIVLDVERNYPPESLLALIKSLREGNSELAVAVPTEDRWRSGRWWHPRSVLGLLSRLLLGSSDVFSGLFVIRRTLWEQGGRTISASGPSLVLELLLRRPANAVDVPVSVDPDFRSPRLGLRDLRPLKHVLDGRYGNLSRLIQFCAVGFSGMFVDLTCYAIFQWLLSFTRLASLRSTLFGSSWVLAVSAALSIGIALLWNFTLNRRLTFNDARRGSWPRQFLTYALSNALAIAFSFTLRLYLPTQIDFFARHRLAAAVVGIVAATGLSFSMSRWIVFTRRVNPKKPSEPHAAQTQMSLLQP